MLMVQRRDGKKMIGWPEGLAPDKPRFPTPPWSEILAEAIRRAGSLDSAKLRDAISKMDHNTVFGRFRVDRDGVQIGHKMLLIQWQDGKRVIVWPEELAPDKPRFPTPPWNQRP